MKNSHDTIPEPSEGDRVFANQAVMEVILRSNGDMVRIHQELTAILAQQKAELRHLHNILNKGTSDANTID